MLININIKMETYLKQNLNSKLSQLNFISFLSSLEPYSYVSFFWLNCRYLVSVTNSNNLLSIKHIEYIHNRKSNVLLTDYLPTGINPYKITFNYPTISLARLKRRCYLTPVALTLFILENLIIVHFLLHLYCSI